MKKSIFIISLFALILTGCSKEKNIEQISNNARTDFGNVKVITYNNGLKTGITMLEFPSINAYENALNSLNQQLNAYDSTFYAHYSNLSDEAYDAKQTEVGYNEQQPLIDAEMSMSFVNSMRQSYVAIDNAWMSNTDLDMATYPKKEYPFSLAEMTLLNSSGEVKIGDALLKLTKNGYLWITDGNFSTLSNYNNGDMNVLELVTVKTSLNESSAECTSMEQENVPHYYATDKNVVRHVHHHSYPWKITESAEITSYKKSNNNWKRYAIDLGVQCVSYFKDNTCNPSTQKASEWKRKHNKSIEENNTIWGSFLGLRAKNNASAYGCYEYAGYTNSECLSW